ncbi:PEPxxWA-CTERM sorting domain-containing protein [Sphingomonas sp. BIUV-7]|uniref:PEPxxWA-CTERM sorting domain-containing protein n=1 Tax=Sphingomonas natans TaxID=3063330 RepID=A0ABT8Y6E5_9SPHN|nr:PEPxxWA-CTERM sorting domain-containing protein [Sphingomonas sp. BIUV-7]MDO6413577.1 PEPxxWA-CTERM sorting domain-containing protein [Sphingomonas sp. BIUV-7]
MKIGRMIAASVAALTMGASQVDATTYVKYTLTGDAYLVLNQGPDPSATAKIYNVEFNYYTNSDVGPSSFLLYDSSSSQYVSTSLTESSFSVSATSSAGSTTVLASASGGQPSVDNLPFYDTLISGTLSQSSHTGNPAFTLRTISTAFSATSFTGLSAPSVSTVISAASVPEPATWAMFIGGFGMIGAGMRRRKVSASFA